MSWRPEGWKYGNWQEDEGFLRNPPVEIKERLYNAFEAGADAMLEALKKQPGSIRSGGVTYTGYAMTPELGMWVFIPDDEAGVDAPPLR